MSQIILCIEIVRVCIDKDSYTNKATFKAKCNNKLLNKGITNYIFAVSLVSYIIEVATITRWSCYRGSYSYRDLLYNY